MRALLLSIVVLFLSVSTFAQGSGSELFENGVAAYRSQNYEEAERFFTQALEEEALRASPEAHAATLFNLGNVAFRQGRTVRAVAHFTAASRLRPRDAEIQANLSIARAEAGLDPAVPADLGSTLLHAMRSFTKPEVERLTLVALLLWLGALLFEALRGGALARTLSWCGLGLVLFSFVPYFATLSNTPRGRSMIVSAQGARTQSASKPSLAASAAPFLSEPRADASTLARLAPATEVLPTSDLLPGWVKVRHEGRTGWVAADRLAPSDPRPAASLTPASAESRQP